MCALLVFHSICTTNQGEIKRGENLLSLRLIGTHLTGTAAAVAVTALDLIIPIAENLVA